MGLTTARRRINAFAKRVTRRLSVERPLRLAVTEADAFLISFPKSGRTWLRFLLSHYFAEAAELSFRPNLTTTFSILPNFDFDRIRGLSASIGRDDSVLIPRLFASHLPFSSNIFLDKPVILLVRDPRDVMVSSYFHATRHKRVFSGEMDTFLSHQKFGLPALIRFLNGWAEALPQRRHLILSYEHLHADLQAEIERLLVFVGTSPNVPALRRAIAAASFERMRDLERANGVPGYNYDRQDDQSLRMRNGEAKSYAKWLTADQSAFIIDQCRNGLTTRARHALCAAEIDLRAYESA